MRKTRLTVLSGFVFLLLVAAPAYVLKSAATTLPNSPPVANPDSYTVHGSLLLKPTQNDYDPDNNGVIFDSITTQPSHGTLAYVRIGEYTYTAHGGYVGSDSFTYTIRDTQWAYATGTVTINVVNQSPVANTDSYTVHTNILLKPIQNDSDPDGDWIGFNAIATQPQHGTLAYVRPGEYTYTPHAGYVGPDSLTYSIRDYYWLYSTGTINIDVVNQAPVANTDSYTVHTNILLRPIINDTDPDGDWIGFNAIATQPSHGTLAYVRPGEYTYTPHGGYVGSDSVTYSIRDSLWAYSTGTININVVNQAPIALFDFYVVQTNLLLTPMQNDSDPDGDSFLFDSLATQPQHGTLAYVRPGEYTYTPHGGYSGSDSFTYRIRDTLWAYSTGTVYVLVLPGPGVTAKVPHACCPTDPAVQSSFNPQAGGFSQVTGGAAGEHGPQYGDPVNLATGRESYMPGPDLTIYNPSGPTVIWQRSYSSDRALTAPTGYGSPGFSRGWVHGYDLSLQATPGFWGALKLVYPNGASETVTPQLSGGQPTGAFTTVSGSPYFVTGIPGSPAGTWQSVTITWKDQTKWKFTQLAGTTYALNQLTNRTGQSLNFTWTSSRALTQITDASTSTVLLTLVYGTNGKLATATDAYARKVAYTFTNGSTTAASMLQSVSHLVASGISNPPARFSYTYTIESGQQLNTITVPSPTGSGNSTATINHNSVGKVTSLVDANGNQRIYTYNPGTTQIQVKDPANNVALSWTQKFNATSGLNTGITDAANHSSTNAYTDTANPLRPTSVTDRNGHTTTYTYDSFGNVTTVTNPRGVTTTYSWSYAAFTLGRLMSVQEGSKPATTIAYYEPNGLVQTVTRPEPNIGSGTTTNTYTYDALGNVLTITGPGNNATTQITSSLNYTTDGGYSQSAKVGQPLTATDNLGHVTHFRYDSQGRPTSLTDALGNETNISYNLAGQTDTITLPATGQTGTGRAHRVNGYLYVGGPLTTVTSYDESNVQVRQTTNGYGLEGELLTVGGSTEPVTNTYDALYRVKTLTDGNNNTTTYAYNNIGLPSLITMPGGETTQFPSYDNDGNLLQRIDGNGVVTNYLYTDPESLLTDIQYPASTGLNVHLGYDTFGRRSSMTDGTGSHSYSYGNLDELLSKTTTYTGLPAKTISYTYYLSGSRQTITTPSGTFNYSYDAGGRPGSMTNPFSETTNWIYQDNDLLQTQSLANGAVATHTYNQAGQLTRLLNQIGGNTLSDFSSIAYDGVGNRTSITANIPGATTLNGVTTYQYDMKDQISQETSTRSGGFTDNFGYDSAGNPTAFKGGTKAYNSNNQETSPGIVHDGNGNPTTYKGSTLAFDPENRMKSYGSSLTAGYSGDGLRGWKESSSARTYFLYDGILPIIEMDSSGTVTATNTFGASGLVSRRTGSDSVFYSFDWGGTVVERSDASGSLLSHFLFNAHGGVISGNVSEPFGYKAQFGYYTDSETGMQVLSHRYYDPNSGRFLTRDPISYSGGINLYAYVANNPINFVDPMGTQIRSDRAFRPGDIPKRPAAPPSRPWQPPDRVYEDALQKIGSGTGSAVGPGWELFPGSKSYYDALRGLQDMGFKPFFNPGHWGGSDFEGKIGGHWYHVTVGYPPGLFNLRAFQAGPNNCPPSFVTAHYEASRPGSPAHLFDFLTSW